jgi:hypothetical protein
MGIKDFSKAFEATSIITLKSLAGKTIAIDAMTELYRSALGAKSVSQLTDKYGRPTMHINVIISVILEMHKNKIKQIWCFDSPTSNRLKADELDKRKQRKESAMDKILSIQQQPVQQHSIQTHRAKSPIYKKQIEEPIEEALDELTVEELKSFDEKQPDIDSLEKQAFTIGKEQINDIKFILQHLNIMYLDAPDGFEGEQIASYLSATGQCDGVYSADTDCIPFGAHVQWRRHPRDKKIYQYTSQHILKQMHTINPLVKPTMANLIKACVVLGSDFAPKTAGIGPKTVIKKLHLITLTSKQSEAVKQFRKEPSSDIIVFNLGKEAFVEDQRAILIQWLVDERSFSQSRMDKLFSV